MEKENNKNVSEEKVYKATNINWEESDDEIDELIDEIIDGKYTDEEMMDMFGITAQDEDAADTIRDVFHHNPGLLDEILELPDTVILPKEIWECAIEDGHCQAITDFLAEEYGTCMNGYDLSEELEALINERDEKQFAKDAKGKDPEKV